MAQYKTLYMETTSIPPERTAAEITAELVKAGAKEIATAYDRGVITGLRWVMHLPGKGDGLFNMPARVEPVYLYLLKRDQSMRRRRHHGKDYEADLRIKAARVAWRQLLRWVQSQISLIETGMVEASEVFFPYWEASPGKTVFSLFKEQEFKALPAPKTH